MRESRLSVLVNGFFFLLAGVAAVWALVAVFFDSHEHNWTLVLFIVALWAVVAYWFLPRIHKVLSAMYVPNYFIGRSRTSEGIMGDPINIAFDGSADHIHRMMQAAGWTLAEPVNLSSGLKIVEATVTRKSYPTAPVSTLEVFERMQDFAYQQEIGGSPGKRHHIRFWHCPPDWPLPGGRRVGWVAAGTYDRSVGLSLFTLQVTHKIGDDIDGERDHVLDSLREVDPNLRVDWIEDFSTAYHSRNGGGDLIATDGNLAIVDLTEVPRTVPTPDLKAIESMAEAPDPTADDPRVEIEKIPRPGGVYLAVAVILAMVAAEAWRMIRIIADPKVVDSLNIPNLAPEHVFTAGIVISAALIVLLILLGLGMWFGYRGARIALVLVVGFEVVHTFLLWVARDYAIDRYSNMLSLSIAIIMLVVLTSPSVTSFALSRVEFRRQRDAYLQQLA
ncbi:LssY C-terminal domain-containing protein [Actinomycetaceae bacterium MB13-C1-2]|nr:LssY C-terminal domain-containing protein [Actinomycetaceae bacterium MB13-C1-2]